MNSVASRRFDLNGRNTGDFSITSETKWEKYVNPKSMFPRGGVNTRNITKACPSGGRRALGLVHS